MLRAIQIRSEVMLHILTLMKTPADHQFFFDKVLNKYGMFLIDGSDSDVGFWSVLTPERMLERYEVMSGTNKDGWFFVREIDKAAMYKERSHTAVDGMVIEGEHIYCETHDTYEENDGQDA